MDTIPNGHIPEWTLTFTTPITTVSDHPNDLSPLTPSCFLGQHLSPNTPLSGYHDKGDLRKDYIYNATLAHRFWLS